MAPPNTVQDAIEKINLRMRQLEAGYLRAVEYQKSLEWQQLRDSVLSEIVVIISTYHGKDATEAVFKCGQIKQTMLKVQQPLDIVVEYEGYKRQLESYYAMRGE